ncbi:MAG: DNA polymerase I [Myxococcota bacterium]
MKLVLVDGTAMAYRAFYAIPGNLSTKAGVPTNATFGFATMFRKLFAGRNPTHGAVIFDPPGRTFRDEAYPEYKAERSAMPELLSTQLPWIRRLVEAFNFRHHTLPGYEADDVIGTLTRQAVTRDMEVLIVSGDKDFSQLIGPKVRMLDAMRDITYDEALVRKKWGVPPKQFVDLLALLGDKIDNIPGVAGIGKKGAVALLEAYGDLEGILAHLDGMSGRQRRALEAGVESARISKDLATIRTELDLSLGLDELRLAPPEPKKLDALFRKLEFFSLLGEEARRADEVELGSRDYRVLDGPSAAERLTRDDRPTAVEPLVGPENHALADWVGCAFSTESGERFYVPFPIGQVPDGLRSWFEDEKQRKLCHDAKQLYLLGLGRGLTLGGLRGDTKLASFLVDPNKLLPHRLDQLSKEFLQETLRPIERLVGTGQSRVHPRSVPTEQARDHACHRADCVRRCWEALRPRLQEMGQVDQLRTQDLPLSEVLARMERHGILVDQEDLARMGDEFGRRLRELEHRIHQLAGRSFNIASTKQLSTVLFEELGLPVVARTKTGYSTKVEVLEKLAKNHEIASLLLEHRRLSKLISTYTNVLQAAVQPETGRIHANFQQTASQTGRLISTDPDLQRTPIRTAEGKRIRRAFVVPEGHRLLSADWSQIELRILAHMSQDPILLESYQKEVDVHRRTAAELLGKSPEAITSEERGLGKTINFSTIYGQGATALSQIAGVTRKEAEAYIRRYFETYAGVRDWRDKSIEQAKELGWAETLFGRRRLIPELSSHSAMDFSYGERVAANTPIQGSAADICKLAMLRIDARLRAVHPKAVMIMQIHDELVFEVPESEVEAVSALVKNEMESVVELSVPLVAEVGFGPSWAEAH